MGNIADPPRWWADILTQARGVLAEYLVVLEALGRALEEGRNSEVFGLLAAAQSEKSERLRALRRVMEARKRDILLSGRVPPPEDPKLEILRRRVEARLAALSLDFQETLHTVERDIASRKQSVSTRRNFWSRVTPSSQIDVRA